ncbi:MAG TPA: YceI family protein [Planctomycetota bacterium]|nr:YceI family protein [Planctomycetota bacterium]
MPCRPCPPTLLSALALFAALLVAAAAPAPAPAPPSAPAAPAEFSIDPVHSSVIFRIQHMGVSYFHGRFNRIEGGFTLDAEKPENSSVEILVPAESVDTNSTKRDDHIRSPDFLNASEFPEIRFKSDAVKSLGKDRFEVAGQLTLHGETKPLTVEVHQTGLAETSRGALAGFETTFTIKRSDFGMSNMLDALGDEVRLTVAVEGRGK